MDKVAIVGAGLAGFTVARKLRSLGFAGSISLFGDEGEFPYNRPPLSKDYLSGEQDRESLHLQPQSYYQDNRIEVFPTKKVLSIDASARKLRCSDGEAFYDALALTTGAVVRQLQDELTAGLSGVHSLRGLADATTIASTFNTARHVLVVGGGYIGLEMAATAVKKKLGVTLIEAAPRILARVAAAPTSDYFRELHRAHGVDIREGVSLVRLTGEGHVSGAVLSDGTHVAADCVSVGIGVLPNSTLAEKAGLAVQSGIRTNEYCQTSDPSIWAAGDCATFPCNGQLTHLESVGNAIDMAECVAENILGAGRAYVPKPWFWSDQYDTRLQIAGLGTGYDRIVVRPGAKNNAVSHWYYKGDRLLAADVMNESKSYMVAKRLIEIGRSPEARLIADKNVDLKTFLAS